MSKAITNAQSGDDKGISQTRKRTSISFRRKRISNSTPAASTSAKDRGAQKAPTDLTKSYCEVVARAAGRPINQRYRQLDERGGFKRFDPERPSKKHRAEGMDVDTIEEEINALYTFLIANLRSIARRTPEPEALLWPLTSALACLIEQYLDERSEYEMGVVEEALLFLEGMSGGKVQFARKGRRRQ